MNVEERRAEFGERLSQLRESAGLSGVALAKLVGWPASKTSRMQRAQQKITETDVRTWCEVVGVDEATTRELLDELAAIRLDEARWRTRLRRGHQPVQSALRQTEGDASIIRGVSVGLVPGLLQVPDYARAVFSRFARVKGAPDDADTAVNARMQRQAVLYDSTKTIELLTTESSLRQQIASPEVMAAQYDRLRAAIGVVRFGIIPDAAVPFPLMHDWSIDDDQVRIETLHTEIATDDPDDVAMYNAATDELWGVAAEGDDARTILAQL